MIKKLRIKFIVMTGFALILVLTLIMGVVNILNYRSIVKDADSIISVLVRNDGRFPDVDVDEHGINGFKNEDFKEKDIPGIVSAETPYELRYFSVLMNEDGQVISTDMGRIAAVDTDTAIQYAYEIINDYDDTKGFIGIYRYMRYKKDNNIRIIFLDCSRSLGSFNSFLLTSCGISLAGIIAVLLIIVIFSGRIVRPFAQSYEKQREFITNAGHEIKTPLTIIDADAEILSMEMDEENEWLNDIFMQTKRLTKLTNDLICLARMEESQTKLNFIDIPISDIVEETVQSFEALSRTLNKTIEVEIEPLQTIKGDEKALRQLISILMDNALKYSPGNSIVHISLDKRGKSVCLAVENSTIGQITKDQLAHLFERFYRADTSRNSQTGGYGIGLSMAKAVVEAHKGKISASTTGGESINIKVLLPKK